MCIGLGLYLTHTKSAEDHCPLTVKQYLFILNYFHGLVGCKSYHLPEIDGIISAGPKTVSIYPGPTSQ